MLNSSAFAVSSRASSSGEIRSRVWEDLSSLPVLLPALGRSRLSSFPISSEWTAGQVVPPCHGHTPAGREGWDKRGILMNSLLLVELCCWSQQFIEVYALVERQSGIESRLCCFLFFYFNLLFSERIKLVMPFFLSLLCLLMLLFSACSSVCR